MQARNAAGRRVSLLNDERASSLALQRPPLNSVFSSSSSIGQMPPQQYSASRSSASEPNTPELLRSESYDSHTSGNDPLSPMTPSVEYPFSRPALYSTNSEYSVESKRYPYAASIRSASYDDEVSATSPQPERTGKRYPCRYRDSHGCDKTFTTSGHASRHSKIHTAEKGVQCVFPGCAKKFTRADNMKQHLETHFKDKTRQGGSARNHRAAVIESRRHTTTARSRNSISIRAEASPVTTPEAHWNGEHYPLSTEHRDTAAALSWEARNVDLHPYRRPSIAGRIPSSGLDALAMAVACQEGGLH